MAFNYENYLTQQLNIVKNDLGTMDDYIIEVATEQAFMKYKDLTPKTIYVVIKYLTSQLSYGSIQQPTQIMVLAETNTLENTKLLLDTFTERYNWYSEIVDGTYVKQQYSTPVVLNNFNEISYGYRSVLYLTTTLYLMTNISDFKDFTIDGVSIKPLNVGLSYSMTPNTQQLTNDFLASSVKNVATLGMTMALPLLDNYLSNEIATQHTTSPVSIDKDYEIVSATSTTLTDIVINHNTNTITFTGTGTLVVKKRLNLMKKILRIISGATSGNADFSVIYAINGVSFNHTFKLISTQITTAPNEVPSINLSFLK